MSQLQDELQQSQPFPSLRTEALVSVVRTAAVINHVMNETLKPYDLTATQYNVLRILRGADDEGLCGRQIGERLVSPVPDVSRLIDRMEEVHLLVRKRSITDRRYVSVHIAPKGLQLLEKVTPFLEAAMSKRFDGLTPAELTALIASLESLR